MYAEREKGKVPNAFLSVEQTLSNDRESTKASRCHSRGALYKRPQTWRNGIRTENNCHQKKRKKRSENGRKTFGHVNKILLP